MTFCYKLGFSLMLSYVDIETDAVVSHFLSVYVIGVNGTPTYHIAPFILYLMLLVYTSMKLLMVAKTICGIYWQKKRWRKDYIFSFKSPGKQTCANSHCLVAHDRYLEQAESTVVLVSSPESRAFIICFTF